MLMLIIKCFNSVTMSRTEGKHGENYIKCVILWKQGPVQWYTTATGNSNGAFQWHLIWYNKLGTDILK